MKEIDKYYFPYVDNMKSFWIHIFGRNDGDIDIQNGDIIANITYKANFMRFVNGKYYEVDTLHDVFDRGIVSRDLQLKVIMRFLKEKHYLIKFRKAHDMKIPNINEIKDNLKFLCKNIFSGCVNNELCAISAIFDYQYREFNKLFYCDIMKIKKRY